MDKKNCVIRGPTVYPILQQHIELLKFLKDGFQKTLIRKCIGLLFKERTNLYLQNFCVIYANFSSKGWVDAAKASQSTIEELQGRLYFFQNCYSYFTLSRHVRLHITVGPWLSGWLGPEKVPDNRKKIPVLDYRDRSIARMY